MRNPFLFFLLLFLGFIHTCARAQTPIKGVFIEARRQNQTLFLFGSIHLGKEDFYPLSPQILHSFSRSDLLALEVDLNAPSAELQQKVLSKAMLPPSTSLSDVLSKDTYSQLKSFAEKINFSLPVLDRFKPWFAGLTLSISSYKDMGLQEKLGLDHYFLGQAKEKKLPVLGLETLEEQINLFDSLEYPDQEAFLLETIQELKENPDDLSKLIHAWKIGDLSTLENFLLKKDQQTGFFKKFYAAIIYERNTKMAKKLLDLLEKKESETIFAVVGALHLVGEKGIIEILRSKNFVVTQH